MAVATTTTPPSTARSTAIAAVDDAMANTLTPNVIAGIIDLIPDVWLAAHGDDPAALRDAYRRYFTMRLESPRRFAEALRG